MVVIGEIYEISKEHTICWKITKFFSLTDEAYYSPEFSFANREWYLGIYPNGNVHEESDTNGYISVYLLKFPDNPPIRIAFSFSLLTSDGKKDLVAHKDGIFTEFNDFFGFPNFVLRSELMEKKSELVPSDTLTLVCSMKLLESTEDAAPQQSKILQDFKKLYLEQEENDVTVRVKEHEFRAHKAILIARSPVIASTFRNNMKVKETGVINIVDCDPPVFSEFLRFLYCGEIDNLSLENVFELFTVADKYDVTDLKTKCLAFLKEKLSKDTFIDTFILALKHSEMELIELTTDFFIKNAQDIISTDEWQSFITQNPIQGNELFIKFIASDRCTKV